VDVRWVLAVASGVLTELATRIIVSVPGWTRRRLEGSVEGAAVQRVVAESLCLAFVDAHLGEFDDTAWIEAVAGEWERAFTPKVCARLLGILSGTSPIAEFHATALEALRDAGADASEFAPVIDVDEFLYALPRRLFYGLRDASVAPESPVRDLVSVLLQNAIASAVEAELRSASPREFADDLRALLMTLESQALREDLPRYVPPGVDLADLTTTIRVRPGIRAEARHRDAANPDPYALPADQFIERQVVSWQDIADHEDRVVILGDPGMGKSWLIRWETARLAHRALDGLAAGLSTDSAVIPLPIRADVLAASEEMSLANAACGHLVSRYEVPERSRPRLHDYITSRKVVLLVDALDELPDGFARQRLDDLLGRWIADPRARFRITSRIAGYTNVPAAPSTVKEFELQPFTDTEVASVISAWDLPADLADRLRDHFEDSAIAGIARIPLLTALMCAVAQGDDEYPANAAGVFERVLRRFLAHENRWPRTPESEATEIDQILWLLAPLAFYFADRPDGWTDRMPGHRIVAVMRALGPVFTELGRDAPAILRDLSVRAGLLVPAAAQRAGHNPPYLFIHRALAEYLVACHLAALPREEWLGVVGRHTWFDPNWRQVIALLGAVFVQQQRPAEAIFLVDHLLGQNPDPFNSALYQAARVASELPSRNILPADLAIRLAERLVGLLESEPDRRLAADFLGRQLVRLPPQVTDTLLARLDREHRQVTADILANSDDVRVISRLTSLLDDDSDPDFDAYMALRGHDDHRVIDEMLARFDDKDKRYRAALVLKSMTVPQVTAKMLQLTQDTDPEARLYALYVLNDREGPEVLSAICRLSDDNDPRIRLQAVQGLYSARDQPTVNAILHSHVEDADALVQISALANVIRAKVTTLAELIEFARHRRPIARSLAAAALAEHSGDRTAMQAVLELANDAELDVRRSAAEALASHPGRGPIMALLRLLDEEECATAAAGALRSHDDAMVTSLLLEWLSGRPSQDRLIRACAILATKYTQEATDFLLASLGSQDEAIRAAAATALDGRPALQITQALIERLSDTSASVRQAVATALRSRGDDPDVYQALLTALSDESASVRRAAVNSLDISDRHPGLMDELFPLLTDGEAEVRDAVIARFASALSPRALLALCKVTQVPDRIDFRALTAAAKQLADQCYRMLTDAERSLVWQKLARLDEITVVAEIRISYSNVSSDWVDDELLKAEIIILLQGDNLAGKRVYTYVQVTGRHLRWMFDKMQAGENFKPANFGPVLVAGTGEPPLEVREEMRIRYNMTDVPMPKIIRNDTAIESNSRGNP
jgi:HEAT repeat protein